MKKLLIITGLAALVGCQSSQLITTQDRSLAYTPGYRYTDGYCNSKIPGTHTGGTNELRLRILRGDLSNTGIRPEQVPAVTAWLDRVEDNRAAMMRTWAITNAIESVNRNRYSYPSYPSNYPGSWINPLYVEVR